MPTIITRGASSNFGFGWGQAPIVYEPVTPGTIGIFRWSGARSNIYTFATQAVTLTVTIGVGGSTMAAGNTNLGITLAGRTSYLYRYAGEVTTTGPAILRDVSAGTVVGNADKVYIAYGNDQTFGGVYRYAANVMAASANTLGNQAYSAAGGNSSVGIIKLGASTTTNRYTFATELISAASALLAGTNTGAALSMAEFAIFMMSTAATTNRYTFATDTVAAAQSLVTGTFYPSCAGNDEIGVVALSRSTATTNVYTYATNGVAAGTNLIQNSGDGGSAFSNGITGVTM